jgi:hypothetical protein
MKIVFHKYNERKKKKIGKRSRHVQFMMSMTSSEGNRVLL